jgi:hypothetical protein
VAKRSNELGKDRAPPKRHQAPDPDPKLQGRPRKARDRSVASRADDRQKPDRAFKQKPKGKSKKKSKDD